MWLSEENYSPTIINRSIVTGTDTAISSRNEESGLTHKLTRASSIQEWNNSMIKEMLREAHGSMSS